MDRLNMTARSEVLEMALNLEHEINLLTLLYLDIPEDNTKAFGSRSGGFTFRNKIDLLLALGVISQEENSDFNTVMEIRNKFMHILEHDTYAKTADAVNATKKLLKLSKLDFECDIEFRLEDAFKELFIQCLAVILEKHKKRENELNKRKELVANVIDYSAFIINGLFSSIERVNEKFTPTESESPEVIKLKSEFVISLNDEVTSLLQSDQLKEMHASLGNENFMQMLVKHFTPKRQS